MGECTSVLGDNGEGLQLGKGLVPESLPVTTGLFALGWNIFFRSGGKACLFFGAYRLAFLFTLHNCSPVCFPCEAELDPLLHVELTH